MLLRELYENLFREEETPASKEAKEKNLIHRGHGIYSTRPDGPPEFRSINNGQKLERIPQQQQQQQTQSPQKPTTSQPSNVTPDTPSSSQAPKTIKSNTFDRNIARLRSIPDDQFPGGHEGKRKAEQRLLKKWDNYLNARSANKGQDRESQFKDFSDFPGGPEAYQQLMGRIKDKYGEIPDWDRVSARSEIPDAQGGETSLSAMIPGYEPDQSPSSPSTSAPNSWPTEPAQVSPSGNEPQSTPTPTGEPTSSSPLEKMKSHFGGDLNKVRDTLQKRIDFHSANPSADSQAKIDAAKEMMAQLEPQTTTPTPAPSGNSLSAMIPTAGAPASNSDPVPTPEPSGDISIEPQFLKAAQKQLTSADGNYDAARSQLAKRIAKATTPEEKKQIAQIAQALNHMEKQTDAEVKSFADKIKDKEAQGIKNSRAKYALAANNPNKGL